MTKQPQRWPVRLRSAILIVGSAALLAACTSGTSSGGSTGTATPSTTSAAASPSMTATASAATCKHVASLNSSLENLTHLQLSANASAQIRKDVTNIQTQLAALKAEAGGAFSTQVSQLSAAVNRVLTAAQGMTANPSAAQIQAITSALAGLKAQSKATVAQLKAICPNA